jgi:1,2-diacylglycerol 3-alpha-glucosyltransferase
MKKGNIVLFNDSYPPIIDGVAHIVLNYARSLGELGWNCTVVAPYAPGLSHADEIKSIRYLSIPLPGRYPYRIGIPELDKRCMRELAKLDADLVHVHCPFSSGKLGLKFARTRQIPVVGSFHTQYQYDFKNAVRNRGMARFLAATVGKFYDALDEVWVPNEFTGNVLRAYGYRGTYKCVPYGTDFAEVSNIAELRSKGNTLLGVDYDQTVLLFVGRIVKEKDPEFLLNVMRILKSAGNSCKLILIGEGFYLNAMKKRCELYGLGDTVKFTGPIYNREELKSCFARADLSVFPSEYDTVGMVVQEAAALGVPSILVQGSAAAINVEHGANGFALPMNAELWASKIAELLSSLPKLKAFGENARKTLSPSWNSAVQVAQGRYNELLAS